MWKDIFKFLGHHDQGDNARDLWGCEYSDQWFLPAIKYSEKTYNAFIE